MTSSGKWRAVDPTPPNAPRLLLKANFTSNSYDVQLTDLCRIWAEHLSKRDIIRRAWDTGCSIDPSEDDEQFSIFLAKVEGALNGEDGTTLNFLPDGNDGITLKLSAPLPKPLPTLFWTVSLTRQQDDAVATALTIPLLHQASSLQEQVQQLIHELHEKDRVISKITDRLETSGNDLTTVFPGVSNIRTTKKKTQREQLARHVKGLADFDEAAWRKQSAGLERSDVWEKPDSVLSGLPEPGSGTENGAVSKKWWQELAIKEGTPSEAKAQKDAAHSPSTAAGSTSSLRDGTPADDEFQRQSTPEHLKSKAPVQGNDVRDEYQVPRSPSLPRQPDVEVSDGDSTTDDEDDLDAPLSSKPAAKVDSQQSKSPSRAPAGSRTKKLGALGGHSLGPSPSPAKSSTPEPQQPASKVRGRLGGLGGKAKAPQASKSDSAEDEADPASPAAASTQQRKMGIIGGKRKASTTSSVPMEITEPKSSPGSVSERSRAPTKEPSPPLRETSQERADKKRDQLRKELEQKAKAPAKKKRKF